MACGLGAYSTTAQAHHFWPGFYDDPYDGPAYPRPVFYPHHFDAPPPAPVVVERPIIVERPVVAYMPPPPPAYVYSYSYRYRTHYRTHRVHHVVSHPAACSCNCCPAAPAVNSGS